MTPKAPTVSSVEVYKVKAALRRCVMVLTERWKWAKQSDVENSYPELTAWYKGRIAGALCAWEFIVQELGLDHTEIREAHKQYDKLREVV